MFSGYYLNSGCKNLNEQVLKSVNSIKTSCRLANQYFNGTPIFWFTLAFFFVSKVYETRLSENSI